MYTNGTHIYTDFTRKNFSCNSLSIGILPPPTHTILIFKVVHFIWLVVVSVVSRCATTTTVTTTIMHIPHLLRNLHIFPCLQ